MFPEAASSDIQTGYLAALRNKNIQDRQDDRFKKTDERIENTKEEEADKNKHSIGFDPGHRILEFSRCKTHENFGAVEGWYGDEVECRQHHIDMGHILKGDKESP